MTAIFTHTQDSITLAILALQKCVTSKNERELCDHLDTALRELGDAISAQGIQATDQGITMHVLPVIIQLKLMARGIELDLQVRGRKK